MSLLLSRVHHLSTHQIAMQAFDVGDALAVDLGRCYGSILGHDSSSEDGSGVGTVIKTPYQMFKYWVSGVSGTDSGRQAVSYLEKGADALGLPEAQSYAVKAGYALYDVYIKTGGFRGLMSTSRRLQFGEMYDDLSSSMTDQCRVAFKDIDSVFTTGHLAAGAEDTSNADPSQGADKIKCDTWAQTPMAFQLCRGISVTNASTALITGSITNTGTATLCGLTLLIGNFDQALSFYPSWLPSLSGSFKPGDVVTFGATVPINPSEPVPSVDVDDTLTNCSPIPKTLAPTAAPTNVTNEVDTSASTTVTEIIQPEPAPVADPPAEDDTSSSYVSKTGVDWGYFAGDTRCLGKCMQGVDDLQVCDAVDMIFNDNCGLCGESTMAAVKQQCLKIGCNPVKCHVLQDSPAVTTSGGHSVKSSLSVLLGFLSLALVLQIR